MKNVFIRHYKIYVYLISSIMTIYENIKLFYFYLRQSKALDSLVIVFSHMLD